MKGFIFFFLGSLFLFLVHCHIIREDIYSDYGTGANITMCCFIGSFLFFGLYCLVEEWNEMVEERESKIGKRK